MPFIFNMQATNRRGMAVAGALLLVYVVWGTTYFAMGIALETMPPLLMNAVRFLCAGVVMLLVALAQGHALTTRVQWRLMQTDAEQARHPLPKWMRKLQRAAIRLAHDPQSIRRRL